MIKNNQSTLGKQEKYNPNKIEAKWPRKNFSNVSHRPIRSRSTSGNQRSKQVEYDPQTIESKWREIWTKQKTFQVDVKKAKKPYFNLMMFPYPSAEGLHIGNVYAFTGSDIWGRYMRLKGYDVLEPIGLDGFGIHSENYAIKVGKHPAEQAKISEANFYRQLKSIGNQFSWDNHLETYDPEYYKWTQWIFVQMFKAGLAYRKKASVNWCPSCKTVLADEQVIEEKCERCDSVVAKKDLEQWFFKITDYADRLLNNLDKIDWSEKVKIAQRQWIGKSDGIKLQFRIENSESKINVFTTAIDTIYGATFLVLSPDHPILEKINISKKFQAEVRQYIEQNKHTISNKNELLTKTGVFTGLYAINPINNREVPIWIANYVLMEYGYGAVMGVPGHDARDHEFALKYQLPIIPVIKPSTSLMGNAKVEKDGFWDYEEIKSKFATQSELFNSDYLNGLTSQDAKNKLNQIIPAEKNGELKIHYHLRDWLISRQRYWGPPIPMVYCKACAEKGISWFNIQNKTIEDRKSKIGVENRGLKIENNNPSSTFHHLSSSMVGWYPIDEKNLPLKLPYVKDYRPKGTGRGPLAQLKDWMKVKCPHCGGEAERETDVSDTFLDSAWYFLRYPSVAVGDDSSMTNLTRFANRARKNSKSSSSHSRDTVRQLADAQTLSNLSSSLSSKSLAWNPEITKKWLPVNMYIGGAEHSVLHLLYSRFITMFFKDQGWLDFEEPFTKFRAHGLIIKDGFKMSKSKGNIVNPDEYIAKYGVDALRCYLMFVGPLADGGDFKDTGMVGMYKFLARVWRLCQEKLKITDKNLKLINSKSINNQQLTINNSKELFWLHKTIKRVTEGIERLKYNTSLAAMMEFINFLKEPAYGSGRSTRLIQSCSAPDPSAGRQEQIGVESIKTLLLLLAPFAPHMTEELWQQINLQPTTHNLQLSSIHHQPWPQYDEKYIQEEMVEIVVQVNGKLRDRLTVEQSNNETMKQSILEKIKTSVKLQPYLQGKTIKKTIFVPGKLINLVV